MSPSNQHRTPSASPPPDQAVAVDPQELEALRQELARVSAELGAVTASLSWRVLKPLHWWERQQRRIRKLLQALPHFRIKAGGWRPLAEKGFETWRNDGFSGLRARLSCQIASLQSSPGSSVVEPAATEAVSSGQAVAPYSATPEVLFISHEASRTGAPVFLLSLIRRLKQELHISCVILLGCGGELEAEFRELGPTFTLASRMLMDPGVLQALQRRNIRLIYASSIVNGVLISALRVLQRPIICHVHELAYSIEKIFGATNLQQTLESTDLFLAGSRVVADYLAGHVPRQRIQLAYPFIDQAANLRQASCQPKPLDLPADAIVVGGCGTVGWRKGTDLFVHLAAQVSAKTAKPVVFVWVGGPLSYGEFSYLPYDIEQLGLSGRLIMTGSVKAHIPYLAQFDIFVLPSREDPFPLVVLDAASLGKPVVCFAQAGGAPEFIEQDAGFVVPYLAVSAMADAVVRLVEDAALRQQMGACGSSKVAERHDIAPGFSRITQIFQDALQQERERQP